MNILYKITHLTKQQYSIGLAGLFIILFFVGCEKEIKLNIPVNSDKIVVEGHIENGIQPFVILTKNVSFYGNINLNNIGSYFVGGAKVTVITDNDSIQLQEYNGSIISLLPDSIAISLAAQFGLTITKASDFPPIIIYTVALSDTDFVGVLGKRYDLRIEKDAKILTSTTTIPQPAYFDSLWLQPHPDASYADSFFQVYGQLKDPVVSGNFYRYFTRVDNEPFLTSEQSVFDDALISGGNVKIFIPKGNKIGSNPEFNFNDKTAGYWNVLDSFCYIKLSMLDQAHYDFWRTVEANRNSQGNPFGNSVVVKGNINGGLGIWGGYGSITGVYRRFLDPSFVIL